MTSPVKKQKGRFFVQRTSHSESQTGTTANTNDGRMMRSPLLEPELSLSESNLSDIETTEDESTTETTVGRFHVKKGTNSNVASPKQGIVNIKDRQSNNAQNNDNHRRQRSNANADNAKINNNINNANNNIQKQAAAQNSHKSATTNATHKGRRYRVSVSESPDGENEIFIEIGEHGIRRKRDSVTKMQEARKMSLSQSVTVDTPHAIAEESPGKSGENESHFAKAFKDRENQPNTVNQKNNNDQKSKKKEEQS